MPTINTKDLTGAALDWAVAKAEDDYAYRCFDGRSQPQYQGAAFYLLCWKSTLDMHYSTNPAQGHPIIEREHICTFHYASDEEGQPCEPGWGAQIYSELDLCHGPTALVAAMRCWVAFKLGPTVDVPAELLQPTTA